MSAATPLLDTDPAGIPVGHRGTRVDVAECDAWAVPGGVALIAALLILIADAAWFVWGQAAATTFPAPRSPQ